ncbi:MAG: tRNA uridine-5-carboxymethylaminomethyl(34) synthesis GTPase MnmE [Bacteroidales bacterium]|jgi:tRNA modification GTPase|nr:tRNA uridine-5-carboxymethylaminomethyl(34) synthesis GTPase MnmE [Bacteroidales bacterium]
MKNYVTDTICAISTGGIEAAIALVRLSGPDAISIADKIFQSKQVANLKDAQGYRMYFGRITDQQTEIDEVLASVFFGPKSYTGENIVEISCHGSLFVQQRILELLQANGARIAEPGEFTKRAFLNGKMDLNQAEAVSDLIASDSKASHHLALKQMKDGFSREIKSMRDDLLKLVSLMELELDFSEEDVEFADRTELKALMERISDRISALLSGFRYGNVLKNGMPVVIAGKPNVGKSSLLNALLKEDRAIVSHIPGTTRDSLEDDMVIAGIRFRFIDTAGLRDTKDEIEGEGIRRAYDKIKKAGIVLLMVESHDDISAVMSIISSVRETINESEAQCFLLQNKADIHSAVTLDKQKLEQQIPGISTFVISAKIGSGISELTDAMVNSVQVMKGNADVILSNMRHVEALGNASEALSRANEALQVGVPSDLVSQDLREVLHHLGLITGEISTDEVLGEIFRSFCIGK